MWRPPSTKARTVAQVVSGEEAEAFPIRLENFFHKGFNSTAYGNPNSIPA